MNGIAFVVTPVLLGIAHAFDADHVVAVSGLVATTESPWKAVRLALVWGIGHTVPILGLAIVALTLGASLPAWSVEMLERFAGGALVVIGAAVLFDLRARGMHIHAHSHDGTFHTHFHSHGEAHSAHRHAQHGHTHVAALTGVVHGLAGSATAIALLPLGAVHSTASAMFFVGVFGLSVAATMAIYALALGGMSRMGHQLGRFGHVALLTFRRMAGAACVGVGLFWIIST